jgi:hypothetical protein
VTEEYDRSSDGLITTARGLMRHAGDSWSSMAGRLTVRDDEAWLDEGRRRYHGDAPMETSTPPDISAVGYYFSVIREPWHVRMQLMHSAPSGNLEDNADLIVYREQTWWARTGSQVRTNGINADRRCGLYGLELMICPQSLADTMDYRQAREANHGRPAILVSAGASEMIWRHAPEQVVLSASRYELEVDKDLGILLANRAYIDDRISRDIELHDIRLNPSFDNAAEFGVPAYPEEG